MKPHFIFLTLMLFAFSGCAQQKNAGTENPENIIRAVAEEWRSASPVEDEFTEHGTDLTIELNNYLSGARFSHIIYNGRKSFPATVDTTENNTLLIQARVVYESEMLARTSNQSDLTDRLVFQYKYGETDFIPIQSWTEKPLSYR